MAKWGDAGDAALTLLSAYPGSVSVQATKCTHVWLPVSTQSTVAQAYGTLGPRKRGRCGQAEPTVHPPLKVPAQFQVLLGYEQVPPNGQCHVGDVTSLRGQRVRKV